MRKYLWTFAALVMAVVISACGSSEGEGGNTSSKGVKTSTGSASAQNAGSSQQYAELKWGFTSWPGGAIDELKVPWPQVYEIQDLVTQSLVECEPDGAPKLGLATSLEQPNPTTYVYKLRHGVRFSDGHALTSADVVYSLDRNITGKEAWTHGYWEDAASVSARGPYTVVIKLKHPQATWESVMDFTSPITEKAQLASIGEKQLGTPSHLPIGTGPWKLDSYTPEASAKLSVNPYWKGAKQPAKTITFTIFKDEASLALALRSGAVDGTFGYAAPKTFESIPNVAQLTAAGTEGVHMAMNTAKAPFNNVHVRRAVAYATDVKGITKALYPGTASESPSIVPSNMFADLGNSEQINEALSGLATYEFDLAAAKRELAKSPDPHGFTTTIAATGTEKTMVSAAEIIASDLSKIGIKAKVQELQIDEETPAHAKTLSMFVVPFYSVYADPEAEMSSLLPPSTIPLPNYAEFNNAEVNKLMAQSSETEEPAKRLELIAKTLKIVGAEEPYVPLFVPDALASLSEKYVFEDNAFSNWTMGFSPWALKVKLAS